MLQPRILLWSAIGVSLAAAPADARCRAGCPPAACVCQPAVQYVEKTVYRPVTVMETRVVTVTECRPEVREYQYVECRQVPETKTVRRQYTVMVPEVRTRTETVKVCQPVWREETREYTVMVPRTETRQGTRQVCKMVPVKQTRTVCEDQGHWEQRVCRSICAAFAGCCCPVRTCWCWVPQIVQKEVELTCYKPEIVTEPYTYTVTVWKPEKRTCKVQVCEYKEVPQKRTVSYTVCVPKTVTRTEQVTTYKTVQVPKTCKYTVMVPHQVQRTVQVPVCKMVPQKVKVPVCCPPTCCPPRRCGVGQARAR